MHKYISIILSLVFLLGACVNVSAQYSDYELDKLNALSALPEHFEATTENKTVTKAEFAYMAAKISGYISGLGNENVFSDVAESYEYAPYINYLYSTGIVCGDENGNFNPDAAVDISMASKILVCILGYDKLAEYEGGYAFGYNQVAHDLGLTKGIAAGKDGILTQGNAVRMVENALFTETANLSEMLNGSLSASGDETLLSSAFDVHVYSGIVTEAKQDISSVMFKVLKDKSPDTKENLTVGDTVLLEALGNVDVNKYEMVPSTIWVDGENRVILIYPEKGVEVKYGYIDSVNGDVRDGAEYGIEYVTRLTMRYDETEYDVSASAKMKYDNELTTSAVRLVGNYAKVVLENDEVIFVESWEMKEGGIITNITGTEIYYTQGKDENQKIDELYKYKRKLVFIDGRSSEMSELKTGSVFYYCITDDLVVICASEKVVVEEFKSYSGDTVQIGSDTYKKRHVYYSTDSVLYKEDGRIESLLGITVKAYLAPDGYVLYMMPDSGESVDEIGFYGVVIGIEQDSMEETEAEVKLYKIGEKITEEIYTVNDKTEYYGVTLSEMGSNAKSLTGDGLYYFEVSSSGKITKVSSPYPFAGFEGTQTFTAFVNGDAEFTSKNGKVLYPGNDVNIVVLFEKDGTFMIDKLTWSDVNGRYIGPNAKMEFYGEEVLNDVPSLILIYGSVEALAQNRVIKYGVVTAMHDGVDEQGDICKVIEVTGSSKNSYNVSTSFASKLKIGDFISYYENTMFSDEAIYLMNVDLIQNFSHDPSLWTKTGSFSRGSVSYISDKMVRLADGEAFYFHKATNFFLQVNEKRGENNFTIINSSDIKYGDEIMYFVSGNAIRGVIRITE